MKTLFIVSISGIIFLSSCKQNKSVAGTEKNGAQQEVKAPIEQSAPKAEVVEENTEKPKANEQSIKSLVVSFYSIGGGIDLEAARKFDAWIAAYKTAAGNPIVYEKIGWGREGEIDYCIQLESIGMSDASGFVDAAKGSLSACKMMHFTVNGECKRKRK
jgi:hypothetical protein